MWLSFLASAAVALLFLYLPGFCVGRAFRLNPVLSLCFAPLVSLFLFNVEAIAFDKLGVHCSWITVVGPALGVCAAAWAVSFFLQKVRPDVRKTITFGISGLQGKIAWQQVLAYAAVGIVATAFVFVGNIYSADTFIQGFDNAFHMGTIRSFVDSGCWSVFDSRFYVRELVGDNAIPWAASDGSVFYPTSWHLTVASVISATGAQVTVAINAVNAAIVGVVFPVSMFVLVKTMFPQGSRIIWLGSLCAVAFTAQPWDFLTFGPIYPNVLGNALLPAAMACFMCLFATKQEAGCGLPLRVAVFLVLCASLFLAHSSALFSAVMILAPYLCMQVSRLAGLSKLPGSEKAKKIIGYVVCALVICGIWMGLYYSPFMQNGPLGDWWPAFSGKPEGVYNVLTLALKQQPQWALAILVIVGAVRAIKKPQTRWLVVSYAIVCASYYLCICTNWPIKHILTGFWYTDSHRIAAMVALAGIPLAMLGLDWVCQGVQKLLFEKKGAQPSKVVALAPTLAIAAVFAFSVYCPYNILGGPWYTTAFGAIGASLQAQSDPQYDNIYNADERDFVKEVMDITQGALIINQPNDGSAFARGADGINVYYRILRGYGDDSDIEQSRLIRYNLCDIASDQKVADAVAYTGAQYLLQLDSGDSEAMTSPYLWTYAEGKDNWVGIDAVNDDTPGFEVVLSRGDMRLYKIVGAA